MFPTNVATIFGYRGTKKRNIFPGDLPLQNGRLGTAAVMTGFFINVTQNIATENSCSGFADANRTVLRSDALNKANSQITFQLYTYSFIKPTVMHFMAVARPEDLCYVPDL